MTDILVNSKYAIPIIELGYLERLPLETCCETFTITSTPYNHIMNNYGDILNGEAPLSDKYEHAIPIIELGYLDMLPLPNC